MKLRVTKRDVLRGSVAGTQGHAARCAAQALFEAGGRTILPAPGQSAVRAAVEREASRVLASAGLLEAGAATSLHVLEGGAVRATATQTARAAGRQILRSVGAAAGAGAAIDGGWALVHAVRSVRRGSMTQREAVVHVVREATTGAAATAAGASAAVLLVALTGGVAAPAAWQTRSRASQSSSLRRPSSVHPGGASLRRWVRWRYFAESIFQHLEADRQEPGREDPRPSLLPHHWKATCDSVHKFVEQETSNPIWRESIRNRIFV